MTAYKLFRQRKDGSIGPLFVDRRLKVPIGQWIEARTDIVPKDLKLNPGWHCIPQKYAPHLTERNRVWAKVEVSDYTTFEKPKCQGGTWILAKKIKVLEIYS